MVPVIFDNMHLDCIYSFLVIEDRSFYQKLREIPLGNLLLPSYKAQEVLCSRGIGPNALNEVIPSAPFSNMSTLTTITAQMYLGWVGDVKRLKSRSKNPTEIHLTAAAKLVDRMCNLLAIINPSAISYPDAVGAIASCVEELGQRPRLVPVTYAEILGVGFAHAETTTDDPTKRAEYENFRKTFTSVASAHVQEILVNTYRLTLVNSMCSQIAQLAPEETREEK